MMWMKRSIWVICVLLYIPCYISITYFKETDFMKPGFDFSELELLEEFEQASKECSAVIEVIKTYRYPIESDGQLMNTTVETLEKKVHRNVEKIKFADKSDPSIGYLGEFVIQPHLNCLDQEDPQLLQAIKDEYLDPPSQLPYTFKTGKIPYGDGQPMMIDQRYFQEQRKGGFFIEAGAYDGERESTSLYFELKHGWTGLLVEPMVAEYHSLRQVNRKAWSVNTCLSPARKPVNVNFSLKQSSNMTVFGIVDEVDKDTVEMQCLPLTSLILALGNPRVDFLSLDIEGAEFDVLKTVPWDKIDIRVISVETQFVDLFDVKADDLHIFLESKGFQLLDRISRDSVYIQMPRNDLSLPKRNLPTHSINPTLQDQLTRTSYPLLGRICVMMNVKTERQPTFCKEQFPLDFYRPYKVSNFPSCLTTTQCGWRFSDILESLKYRVGWKLFLSDSCQFIIMF